MPRPMRLATLVTGAFLGVGAIGVTAYKIGYKDGVESGNQITTNRLLDSSYPEAPKRIGHLYEVNNTRRIWFIANSKDELIEVDMPSDFYLSPIWGPEDVRVLENRKS